MEKERRVFTDKKFIFEEQNRFKKRIGKTVPEIAPYLPLFYQAFEDHPQVLETSAYSAISDGGGWRLALILRLRENLNKKQLKLIEKIVPKEIPLDIPVIYELHQPSEQQ